MRKEIQIALVGTLFLSSCAPIYAQAQSRYTETSDPTKVFFDPTLSPTPTIVPEATVIMPTITPAPEITTAPTPTEILDPRAEKCILPFTDAKMEGLQFMSIIKNNGKPVTDTDGTIHRHLGLDFSGGEEGTEIKNMCDGTLVFSGHVKEGYGLNLGNVVVVKYTYEENGNLVNVYMRYAHMENVTNLAPGTIIAAGEKIGEMGHSGGWPTDNTHLHVDLWKEEPWNRIVVDRSQGDLVNEVGYYALGETWSDNTFKKNLLDPRKWLSVRLGS